MIPGKRYTPQDVLTAMRRRLWLIVVPFVLVSAAGIVVVRQLPSTYRAEALIQLLPRPLPDSYVPSTVQSRSEDQVSSLRQEIMTRGRLEQIIRDLDLYPGMRRTTVMENVVDRMRKDITVEQAERDIFKLGYVAGTPQTAFRVTDRLAVLFIEENAKAREGQAEATQDFFEKELEDARLRLEAQDRKLAEYRTAHAGELPSQMQANLEVVNGTQTQMQTLSESVNRDRDQRLYLQRQRDAVLADAPVAAPAPVVAAPTTSVADQLEAARGQLREMEMRLTPENPDVGRLKSLIERLEKKAAAEGPSAARPSVSPAVASRDARMRELDAQIEMLDRQMAAKVAEQKRLSGVVADHRARIAAVPARESELMAVTRDYETIQKRYASLLSKKEDAKTSANLEKRDMADRFRLIDPPRPPERPFSPDRLKLQLLALAAGLGLALALAALAEYRDSSMHTDDDVVTALKLPVLAMIPMLSADGRKR